MDDGCVDNIIIVSRRQDEQRGFFKKQRENKRQGLDIPTWHKYNNSCSSRSWRNRQTRTFEGRMGDRMGSSPIDRTTLGRRLWISHSGAKLWDTPVNNGGVPLFYVHF